MAARTNSESAVSKAERAASERMGAMKIDRVLSIVAKSDGYTWSPEVRALARAYLLARLRLAVLTKGPRVTPATTALMRTIGDLDEVSPPRDPAPETDPEEAAPC